MNVGGRLERMWRMYRCQRQSRTFIGTDWCACLGHCRGQYRCRYSSVLYKFVLINGQCVSGLSHHDAMYMHFGPCLKFLQYTWCTY